MELKNLSYYFDLSAFSHQGLFEDSKYVFDFLKVLGAQNVKNLQDWENLSKNEKVEELLSINQPLEQ